MRFSYSTICKFKEKKKEEEKTLARTQSRLFEAMDTKVINDPASEVEILVPEAI
jgi:hypothetical protein